MNDKVLNCEKKICLCCMEEHEVKTVSTQRQITFKGEKVNYDSVQYYCDNAEEYFEDEEQLQLNDVAMKDAYRQQVGLLTSSEIQKIRAEYDISQNDLCAILGWGGKTITRYEGHQVQDVAHDSVLKKLSSDPAWFVELLNKSRKSLSSDNYERYLKNATALYERTEDCYFKNMINFLYARFGSDNNLHGNAALALNKFVEIVRYFASSGKVKSLYKVKLMKMLWYSDFISFKELKHSITGLVYQSLPMGAVPVCHDLLIKLNGIPCVEEDMGYGIAYHFVLNEKYIPASLTTEEICILDRIIDKFARSSKEEIVTYMHNEKAYKETMLYGYIDYKFADEIEI